jgi:hypothetical protein
MVGSHRDPVDVLLLEATHHPPRALGNLVEGEGLVRHPTPVQRDIRRHLVDPKSVLHQQQHSSTVERGGHHPRGQSTLSKSS